MTVLILDSVLWEGKTHIWGVNLMHFLTLFAFLGGFSGGEFGILGGIPPGDSWK